MAFRSKTRNAYRPILEPLESRIVPATAKAPYTYEADPGEFNDVVISPGTPFSSIQDAADVNQITELPFVASRFLDGLNISISFSIGTNPPSPIPTFSVGVGIGFPLYPYGLPEGVLGPPISQTGTGSFTSNQLIGDAVQQATGGVASAVAGVPVTTAGDVSFEVTANSGTLAGYRLFQAVVDPTFTMAETESNDTAGSAETIDAREIITGNVLGSDVDVFKLTNTTGGARLYSVVLDADPDVDTLVAGTKISILEDTSGGTLPPELVQSNVTFGDANAVGPVEIAAGDTVYVVIEDSGAGDDADGDYRFVLLETDATGDSVTETEFNDTVATANSLGSETGYVGQPPPAPPLVVLPVAGATIPSQLDVDYFDVADATDGVASSRAIAAGDLVFAFVDTRADDDSRESDEIDSFLRVFDAGSSTDPIAEDDNDGPALPATTFDDIQNEIDDLLDLDSLLSLFSSTITVNLNDGNDRADLSKVNGNDIKVTGGTGHDTILHGGGVNDLDGGDDNDIFIFNNLFDASVTIDGGTGFDLIEVLGTDANETFTVEIADDPSGNDTDTDVDDLHITVEANGSTVSTYYRDIATSNIEGLAINLGDGDDLITIDYSAGGFTGLSAGIAISDGGGVADEIRVIDGDATTDDFGHTVIFRQISNNQTEGSFDFVGGDTVEFEGVEEWSITPLDPTTGELADGGRLVVFDRDRFEFNDDRTNATPIEFVENLLTNLTIDLPQSNQGARPADEDWFRFHADKTGTYQAEILFEAIPQLANGNDGLPGDGELTVSIYDSTGALIVYGRDTADGAAATFSALQGNDYFIRVQGGTEANPDPDAVNRYQLLFTKLDLLGPQVFDPDNGGPIQAIQVVTNGVPNEDFNLFDVKPTDGPTPRVDGIKINLRDLISLNPALLQRAPGDVYPALDDFLAQLSSNYSIVGDHVGTVAIDSITLMNDVPVINGAVAAAPVPTATEFSDPTNLIGGALEPEVGDFVIMTGGPAVGQIRQIASIPVAGTLNFGADPFLSAPVANDTFQVLKIATAMVTLNFADPLPDDRYALTISDQLRDPAGNLFDGESNANQPVGIPALPSGNGFPGGSFVARFTVDSRPEIGQWEEERIQIDINGNGVWDPQATGDKTNRDIAFDFGRFTDFKFAGDFAAAGAADSTGFDKLGAYGLVNGHYRFLLDFDHDGVADANIRSNPINGTPVAGDFTNGHPGDEVGLFDGVTWYLDTNGNNRIDGGDRSFSNGMRGHPIVGDFDGDGLDDLGAYQPDNDRFQFDLADNGFGSVDATISYGFPGVQERPVAADMNLDGVDDIGLCVPGAFTPDGQTLSQWYWLVSDGPSPGSVNTIRPPFRPEPFGNDLYFNFGNPYALPLIGNFDPPTSSRSGSTSRVDTFIQPGTGYLADVAVQANVAHIGPNSSAGLLLHYLDQNNFYWGGLSDEAGQLHAEIWRVQGGKWTKLAGQDIPDTIGELRFEATYEGMQTHLDPATGRLDILGSGTNLKLFLGNVLLVEASDSSIGEGLVGTYVTDGNILTDFSWVDLQTQPVSARQNDHATVTATQTEIVVSLGTGASLQTVKYAIADVHSIVFEGYAGDDEFQNYTSVSSTAYGHSGDDVLLGGFSSDHLYGGDGDDRLFGNAGIVWLFGGSGNDYLDAGSGNDRLYGDSGRDKLIGGSGNDYLRGGSGNDRLYGKSGRDKLIGDSGNDRLVGGGGNDKLYGKSGRDRLYGNSGRDRLYGGSGRDKLYGGSGKDYMKGQGGVDFLDGKRESYWKRLLTYWRGWLRR